MNLKFDPVLSTQDEENFRFFLNNAYGLHLHEHQQDKFKKAVYDTCQKFCISSAAALLEKIQQEPFCDERILLIQQITVDESYFFRDDEQQKFLKTEFLPKLIAQKRQAQDKHLRIWSAGCSTGQEIYSIAILLYQLLPDFSEWTLHLLGSDISHQSLEQAIAGKYNRWSIRTDENFINHSGYFTPSDERYYQLKDFIKNKVKFFYLNLAEDTFPSLMNQTCYLDLILCRNVFIYFTPEVIEKACHQFAQALRPEGVLMLSVTDPVNFSCLELNKEKWGEVFYFKRKNEFLVEETQDDSYYSETSLSSFDNIDSASIVSQPVKDEPQSDDLEEIKKKVIPLLRKSLWSQVIESCNLALVNYSKDADLHQFKAKSLVNLGQFNEAKLACEKSIVCDDLDPHTYLLYGLILLQLELYDEAEKAFRQTVFLNHDFMEAHYQLGQVLLYKGQKKQGVKAIKNALKLAEEGDKNQPVHNVITLTYASFSEIIKNELTVLNDKQ